MTSQNLFINEVYYSVLVLLLSSWIKYFKYFGVTGVMMIVWHRQLQPAKPVIDNATLIMPPSHLPLGKAMSPYFSRAIWASRYRASKRLKKNSQVRMRRSGRRELSWWSAWMIIGRSRITLSNWWQGHVQQCNFFVQQVGQISKKYLWGHYHHYSNSIPFFLGSVALRSSLLAAQDTSKGLWVLCWAVWWDRDRHAETQQHWCHQEKTGGNRRHVPELPEVLDTDALTTLPGTSPRLPLSQLYQEDSNFLVLTKHNTYRYCLPPYLMHKLKSISKIMLHM